MAPTATPRPGSGQGLPEPKKAARANAAKETTLSQRAANAMQLRGNVRNSPTDNNLPIASQYATKHYGSNYPFGSPGSSSETGGGSTSVGPTGDQFTTMSPQGTTGNRSHGAMPVSQPTHLPKSRSGMAASTIGISTVRNISAGFNKPLNESEFSAADDKNGKDAYTNGGATNGANSNGSTSNGDTSPNVGPPMTKSGAFIQKITKENDMLKRDVNIYRLQAEQAKDELRMALQKMEQINADCDLKLLNANANETLLARRDRQLGEIKEAIQREKHRADMAVQSEKSWKEQMEKKEAEAKIKVDEATNYAALLEGRYNTLASHWDDQKKEVADSVKKLSAKINAVTDERKKDCENMNSLQAICDQKDAQLTALQKENEAIAKAFEEYKLEQERGLRDIKEKGRQQEKANEETLAESQKVLGELKWALQLNKVRDGEKK